MSPISSIYLMKDNIFTSSASSFAEFLEKNEKLIKSHQGQSLISYIFPAGEYEIFSRINNLRKRQEILFYSEKPSENKFFLGVNSILTLTEKGEKRFSSLEKKIKEAGESYVSNRRDYDISAPLFMGGMKFTVEHSDDYWKDFEDSTWFIPELIYIKNNGVYYFIFNCLTSSKMRTESLISKLENVLKVFFSDASNEETKELRILQRTGSDPKDKKKWKNQVTGVLEKIKDGGLEKVVLSRKVELTFTSNISAETVLRSLLNNYPECTLFLFHIGRSSFVGASPETLARINGSEMILEILAGSADRGKDSKEDENIENDILKSDKNLAEHRIVVDYIKENLQKIVGNMEVSEPGIKKLHNIQHLKSEIRLNLNEHISFLNVIGKIHPTPAVCGSPQDTALNYIKKTEPHQRGLYAGLIGWLNLHNEGEFVLAIRSALATGNKLIAYAGCGIVNGSSPDEEYKETELKLKPFLTIFNNEN
jgi:menaquinone-specific isochorismate synthase